MKWRQGQDERSDRLSEQGWEQLRAEQARAQALEVEIIECRAIIDRARRRETGALAALDIAILGYELPSDQRPIVLARLKEVLKRSVMKWGE